MSIMPKFYGVQFKFLATTLRDTRPEVGTREYSQWDKMVRTIAHDLSKTNENFNKAAFYRVARLHGGPAMTTKGNK